MEHLSGDCQGQTLAYFALSPVAKKKSFNNNCQQKSFKNVEVFNDVLIERLEDDVVVRSIRCKFVVRKSTETVGRICDACKNFFSTLDQTVST
jgi:hypothetical protein